MLNLLKIFFLAVILKSVVHSSYTQNDTITLSIEDCYWYANNRNISLQIAETQYEFAENLRKTARTQYIGNISLAGRYQYTNKNFQFLDNNLFIPVIPFWAIDEQTMDLNENVMDNPLFHGIATNPFTGEVYTDADGNPLFFFYSYLPADHINIGHSHNYVFGPSFNQPIYLGGRIKNINRIADEGVSIAASQRNIDKSKVYYEIQEYFWTIIDLQEKQKLVIAYIDFLERLIYDLNNIYEEGVITYKNVLTAKVKLNEVELNLTEVENGLELAKMYLCHLIGLPLDSNIDLIGNLDDLPILPNPENIEETATRNRSEINILNSTKKIALAQKEIARARFLPSISLSANYLFMNPNPYAGFQKGFGHDYTFGINFHFPLFSWGERIHTLNATEKLIQITEFKKQEAESLIKLEINKTYRQYIESIKILSLREKSLELADETLNLYKQKFEEGMITSADFIEAKANRQKAHSNLIEAKTKLKIIEIKYNKVLGTL